MPSNNKPEAKPFLPPSTGEAREKGVLEGSEYENPARRRRRATGLRLAILAIASCLVLGLFLHPPARRCLHRLGEVVDPRPQSIEERVKKILTHTPLIDGHNDLPIVVRALYNNHIYGEEFSKGFEQGGLPGHVDLPRLRAGQNGGAFWSVYVPCPEDGQDYSDANYAEAVQTTIEQIDLVARLKQKYPNDLSPNLDSSGALNAFKKGQLISPLGIEGLHQIGNRVSNLRQFHALGVRYATLTHNCANRYADSALVEGPVRVAPPVWHGVSLEGRRLINEMNRLGLIVDLSHTSVDTMVDVLGGKEGWDGSKAPVIYSHSSAYSICPHPRNVPDHVLQLVKRRNSLVMVNFAPPFVSCVASDSPDGIPDFYPPNSTLAHVATHIIHIGSLIGFEHVGLGSDFDGIPTTPEGLDDVAKYPDLVGELLRRGVSDEDAAKVVGGNLLRVWKDVDAVAAKLQAAGEPVYEDDLPKLGAQNMEAFVPGQ